MYPGFRSLARQLLKIRLLAPAATGATPVAGTESSEPAASTISAPPAVAVAPTNRIQPDDEHVQQWKGSWVRGAESRWAGTSVLANPHKSGSSRAAAWRAGWHWADRQPDRRQAGNVRFAHAHRRRTDRSSPLVRRAQAGAVGLSMLTIAGWLWQIRRQRRARRAQDVDPGK
ncbi:MAG: hypothetical protein V7647_1457 [Acidobacteriota bacterium]|jgi:hypothetical protein